jgi:hypothetical protein
MVDDWWIDSGIGRDQSITELITDPHSAIGNQSAIRKQRIFNALLRD